MQVDIDYVSVATIFLLHYMKIDKVRLDKMNNNKESNSLKILKWFHLTFARERIFSDHDEHWEVYKVETWKL